MNDHNIAMAQAEIPARDAALAERDERIALLERGIAYRDQTIAHLRALILQHVAETADEATEPEDGGGNGG